MFEKLQQALWKALTPDLVPDAPISPAPGDGLTPAIIAALGGAGNLKSQQPVALTRVRVELQDAARMDCKGLNAAGVAGVMTLENGVVHLITGLQST
jgi:phosphotransferase system IIB component